MSKRGKSKSKTMPDAAEPQAVSQPEPPAEPAPEPLATSPFMAEPKAETSPFIAVHEDSPPLPVHRNAPANPEKPTLFTVVDDSDERRSEPFRLAKIPEKRKSQSPFQIADPSAGFGGMQALPLPFGAAYGSPASPFTPVGTPVDFGAYGSPHAAPMYAHPYPSQIPPPFAPHAFGPPATYPQPYAHPAYAPHPYAQPAYGHPGYHPPAFPPSPYSQAAYAPPAYGGPSGFPPQENPASFPSDGQSMDDTMSDQARLRSLFGVDHEMGADEILQRCRFLPGVRNIACLSTEESETIESLKSLITRLGYDSSALHLYAGQVALEFIREGSVTLAVQTDGIFAPGVRDILVMAAREISRQA